MKRTEYDIATMNERGIRAGRETVKGYVLGEWGTRKGRYFWDFTHLPTGMAITVYPVIESKQAALDHLAKLNTEGPADHVKTLLEKYPGWGGEK